MNIMKTFIKNKCNKRILYYLYFFLILTFCLDFFRNKDYYNIWDKKTFFEKMLLIYYLIIHNFIYFVAYIFPIILFLNKSCNKYYLLFYIFFAIGTLISWYLYNDFCFLTVKQNELLEIDKDYKFRSPEDIILNRHIKLSENNKLFNDMYYYYLYFTIIFSTFLFIR